MRYVRALVLLSLLAVAGQASAEQRVVSTMANVPAVMEADGYRIVPVYDMIQIASAGDRAQPQVFEILRPGAERIRIGRLNTSCGCVRLEAGKTVFEQGERAFLVLRNVRETPPAGQQYALYVQITSPIRATLRADTFFQSDRFRQPARAAPAPAPAAVSFRR